MLLTETISSCTTAIQARRNAQERKRSSDEYAKALSKLAQTSTSLKSTLDCASKLKSDGIVDHPLITQQMQEELLDCINNCGNGIHESTLTSEIVEVLRAKSEAYADQIKAVWKDASTKYSEGVKGYISMIVGFSDDPQHTRKLIDSIEKTVAGNVSIQTINRLVSDVAEAQKIMASFSLSPEIETFLKKVSGNRATLSDLTPEILGWLKEHNLKGKLHIRF